jgi:hypothetical protein
MRGGTAPRNAIPEVWLRIRDLCPEGPAVRCVTDGDPLLLPRTPGSHLRIGDLIRVVSSPAPVAEFLARQSLNSVKFRHLCFCRIGYVTRPKSDKRDRYFVRAEILDSSLGFTSLHFPNAAVRDYFYFFTRRPGEDRTTTLYELLRAKSTASFADLRLCYRIRRLELAAQGAGTFLRAIERAFNLLAHPELRACYDALLADPDSPAVFPYGGFGQCLVSGDPSDDGQTFFVRQLISYSPDQSKRTFRASLRRMEFYEGYAVYRDSRRKAEIYLDAGLLPLGWNPTWNQWKHLVGTKFEVSATFVESGKYRRRGGAWHLVRWQTALPTRVEVKLPADAAETINAARQTYQKFGEHYDAIESIRLRLEREPLEGGQLWELCRKFRIPAGFDVAQFCWKPDYDRFFYEQLRKRAVHVFLFRGEYIFQLGRTVVAEVPQVGHATYVFAKPGDIRDFVKRYAATTRDDIRKNRGNVAVDLGFIGRVHHGVNPRKWLAEIRSRIGEPANYSSSP